MRSFRRGNNRKKEPGDEIITNPHEKKQQKIYWPHPPKTKHYPLQLFFILLQFNNIGQSAVYHLLITPPPPLIPSTQWWQILRSPQSKSTLFRNKHPSEKCGASTARNHPTENQQVENTGKDKHNGKITPYSDLSNL